MGLDLFNFLFKKPIFYVARQRHGMKKGTRIAEETIAKVGPVLAQALLENTPRIHQALAAAEKRIAREIDSKLFSGERAEYALRSAIARAGLPAEVREYVTAYAVARLGEKLPLGVDVTHEAISSLFSAVRNQLDQIVWDSVDSAALNASLEGTPHARS